MNASDGATAADFGLVEHLKRIRCRENRRYRFGELRRAKIEERRRRCGKLFARQERTSSFFARSPASFVRVKSVVETGSAAIVEASASAIAFLPDRFVPASGEIPVASVRAACFASETDFFVSAPLVFVVFVVFADWTDFVI